MSQQMMSYIESQPAVWRQAARLLPEAAYAAAAAMNGGHPVRRVVLVGSGSSHYACRALCCLIPPRCGTEFFSAVPTRLGPLEETAPGTVYWLVSQTGQSTSTQHAAAALRRRGATVWAFTADAQSPLAQCADGHVLIPCGEEHVGPKTKGVTTTILALWLTACALLGAHVPAEEARALAPAFETAAENLPLCRAWAGQCTETLAKAACLTLIAEGPALPLAEEGALKLLETLYVPASAWELEEFLHGGQNIINPGAVYLFLLGADPGRSRMEQLIRYCSGRGASCLCIDCASPQPGLTPGRLAVRCCGSPAGLPYEVLPVFQILSAVVSADKGIECDRPRYPDFYAALHTKLNAGEAGR